MTQQAYNLPVPPAMRLSPQAMNAASGASEGPRGH